MADDVLVILREAMAKEEQRAQFYTEAAQRTCNSLAQATFNVLAGEEQKHKGYINRFYTGMVEKNVWPDMSACEGECLLIHDAAVQVFGLLTEAAVQDVSCETDLTQAYEVSMQAERESITLYKRLLDEASDDNAKAFYSVLLKAERGHLALLSKTLEYLDDSEQWYFEEEQWIVEG